MSDTGILKEVFSASMVDELYDLMGEDMSAVYQAFADSLQQNISELETAIGDGNADEVARITHTLKGSSANVGASTLSELCQILMDQARNNDLSQAAEYQTKIKDEIGSLENVLGRFLA